VTRSVGAQQRAAASQLRDLTGTKLIEVLVDPAAPAAGREVREVGWPPRTILTSIRRRGDVVVPNGATVLEPGDEVVALIAVDQVEAVRELLAGGAPGTWDPRAGR
jgi:chloride channel protein, CIC family